MSETCEPARAAAPLLRPGTRFDGLVVLDEPARLEGRVRGRILASGPLWIGESAWVRGHVEADELVVEGRLEGSVTVRSRVELRATARVRAELVAPRLHLAEGCVLEGRCRTGEEPGDPASSP